MLTTLQEMEAKSQQGSVEEEYPGDMGKVLGFREVSHQSITRLQLLAVTI